MLTKEEQQLFFMRQAIEEGEKGRLTAPPNPWVGSVVVLNEKIVGRGYHVAPGLPHAEIVALNEAGSLAQGATLYITLEPCSHYGKTPPCIETIIKAGVSEVVIPFLDPDPKVDGQGVEILRSKGIKVTMGVGEKEARLSLAPYLFQRKNLRPYVVLKAAISLDGCIAAQDGSSKWITGEMARKNAHLLRAESQAIMVGTKTALFDNPSLTARGDFSSKTPLRVAIDRKGVLSGNLSLLDTTLAPTLIFTTDLCDRSTYKEWEKKGVEVVLSETLTDMMQHLQKRNIIQLLVEGGSLLQTSFMNQRLANRLVLYMGACLLGQKGKPFLDFEGPSSIDKALRLVFESVERFEQDIRMNYLFQACQNVTFSE